MKQKLLKSTMFLLLSFGLLSFISAQEVFMVEAGTDGISTALLDCQNGDIIELTTSGGMYIETGSDSIDVDVTIRAADGLAEKPVIMGGGGIDNVFNVRTGGLNLKGLKFDGGAYVISINAPDGFVPVDFSIRVNDCEFHNWTQRAIYTSGSSRVPLDSVLVKNTIFKDGVKQGFYLKRGDNADVFPGSYKVCHITNCLFTGLSSDSDGHATYIEPGDRSNGAQPWPEVVIDHVTVDNCARGLSTYCTSGAIVKNTIVSNPTVLDRTAIDIQGGRWSTDPLPPPSQLINCIYVGGLNLKGSSTVTGTVENCDSTAVEYKNRAGGNFGLKATSPGKNGATDGTDIGYIGPASLPVLACAGFEEDTSFISWTQDWDNSSVNAEAGFVKSGTKSLKVGPAAGGRAQYATEFTDGSEISILAWGIADGEYVDRGYIGFRATDIYGVDLEVEGGGIFTADGWSQQCASMVVPPLTEELLVYFWYDGDANNATSIYVDDFEFVWGNVCTGTKVEKLDYNSFINVYPNPSSGLVQVSLGKEISRPSSLEVYDVTGKMISRNKDLNGIKLINLDLSEFPAGMYFGKLKSEHGTQAFKILIR